MLRRLTERKLKGVLKVLRLYFSEENPSVCGELDGLEQILDAKEYEIAVVANMSAGKSTFINALLGEELLPSFNEATSDAPVFIFPEEQYQATIYFEDGREPVTLNRKNIRELKLYAQKDGEGLDSKYRNVDRIELFWPLKNIRPNNVHLTLIDTPGPNNTGEFREKHKQLTRTILREVNAALFLFDYTQLDANLESDEQGLWHSIKERTQNDPRFKVIFILNKIDSAIEDNAKMEECEDALKKFWYRKESEAIQKLEKAAIEHGIENPIVLPVSAKIALLLRKERLSRKERRELMFLEEDFRDVFEGEEDIRQVLLDYSGIEKVERYLKDFIEIDVVQIINQQAREQLFSIINREINKLIRQKELLSKPYEETIRKIRSGEKVIERLSNERDLRQNFEKIAKIHIDNCRTTLEERLAAINENEIISILYHFLNRRAQGEDYEVAKKFAKRQTRGVITKDIEIDLRRVPMSVITDEYKKFKKELLDQIAEDFYDTLKAITKREHEKGEEEIYSIVEAYLNTLEKELSESLDIQEEPLEIKPLKPLLAEIDDNDLSATTKQEKQKRKRVKYLIDFGFIKFWKREETIYETVKKDIVILKIEAIKNKIRAFKRALRREMEDYLNNMEAKLKIVTDRYLEEIDTIKWQKMYELIEFEKKLKEAEEGIREADKKLKQMYKLRKALE
ncbi:MAG: dynamin family protein [Campylobacterales bacterium]